MQNKLIIIQSCGSKKLQIPSPAYQLYQGSYFKAGQKYAKSLISLSDYYILSAKYGLIKGTKIIEPYNSLMGTQSQIITPDKIKRQILELELSNYTPLLIGGKKYLTILTSLFKNINHLTTHLSIKGNGMGYQISWLLSNLGHLPGSLDNFYTSTKKGEI